MAKPDLALVLDGAPKKKGPPLMAMGDDEDTEEGLEAPPDIETSPELEDAGNAIMAAFASKDPVEFTKSLKGFVELCKGSGDY